MQTPHKTTAPTSSTEILLPTYRISSYVIYPPGFDRVATPDRHRWCLRVADAGDGWAFTWRNQCLNIRDEWELNLPQDLRTSEFRFRCRYNEHAALQRARRYISRFVVDGKTFDQFVDSVHAQAAEEAREVLQLERKVSAFRQWLALRHREAAQ
jgi:hypothetical protein